MSETITEMILPGTYIEVRAEGLIGVGGIATGNVGVVGTAARGPVNELRVLSSYSEALDTYGPYDAWPSAAADQPNALTLTRTLEQLFRGGASTVYAVRVGDFAGAAPVATWTVDDAGGAVLALQANSPGTWGNAIALTYRADDRTLRVAFGDGRETHDASTAGALAASILADSRLLVAPAAPADPARIPTGVTAGAAVASNGATAGGGTAVTGGLAVLEPEPVNILVVGGVGSRDAKAAVLGHLETTETEGRERIAVLGVTVDDFNALSPDDMVSNRRVVLVTPGIRVDDATSRTRVSLPAPYAAAVVAGRMATLGVQESLTNKDLAVAGLTRRYSRGQQKNLLGRQMLVLRDELGVRVLKGITTDTGAFRQISVRRTVDYAKAGVRAGSNPYIGRLNNVRVRAALKATLDGFLSQMVLDEMLTGYELDVSATRAQEITGQALVTMTLQPTFSIDYVKVIMNLA